MPTIPDMHDVEDEPMAEADGEEADEALDDIEIDYEPNTCPGCEQKLGTQDQDCHLKRAARDSI